MNYRQIRALLRQTFQSSAIVITPECTWTGHECDLLVVHKTLRIIDVEIKLSRADFKRDAAKEKWWHRGSWRYGQPEPPRVHRDWPPRVWKHYFAMPAELWTPELVEFLPSPASGVLLVRMRGDHISWEAARRATPNRAAEKIQASDCIDIARLAGLRMWDALAAQGVPA